jgi:hypothetical protein
MNKRAFDSDCISRNSLYLYGLLITGLLAAAAFFADYRIGQAAPSSLACQLPDTTAYWRLVDGPGATTFADNYGGHDGICTGANCPRFTCDGRVNGAFTFDGSNGRVNAPASSDYDWAADGSFSIETRVRIPTGANCGDNRVFIGLNGGRTAGNRPAWWVGCAAGNNQTSVFLRDKAGNEHQITAGDTSLNNGVWHHVVTVRDGTANQTRIYVNGVFRNSADLAFPPKSASSNGLKIGHFNTGSPGLHLNGSLHELAIHDRALTPAEIERHHQAGLVNLGYEYTNWTTADGDWNDNASWRCPSTPQTSLTTTTVQSRPTAPNPTASADLPLRPKPAMKHCYVCRPTPTNWMASA